MRYLGFFSSLGEKKKNAAVAYFPTVAAVQAVQKSSIFKTQYKSKASLLVGQELILKLAIINL